MPVEYVLHEFQYARQHVNLFRANLAEQHPAQVLLSALNWIHVEGVAIT